MTSRPAPRARLRLAVLGVPVALAAGCTASPPSVASGPPTSAVTEVRRSTLPAPAGYGVLTVEFADAVHGYAGLITDEPVAPNQYGSMLFATDDGGRTWRQLDDPRRPSPSPQLYTVDARTIVLLAEPGWFVSTDGGASFQARAQQPEPAQLSDLSGEYQLACDNGCSIVRRGGQVTQPELRGELAAVTQVGIGGPVWAVSLDDGEPRTTVSQDGGRTWRQIDVPAHPDGRPARFSLSGSGGEIWLIGYITADGGGLGQVMPLRRKETGLPLLWRMVDDRWVAQGISNAPPTGHGVFAVAAIGGGLAAVAAPTGLFLVDSRWHPVELFPQPEWVTTLRDGTVFAPGPTNQTYYLGTRTGSAVAWVQVVLTVS